VFLLVLVAGWPLLRPSGSSTDAKLADLSVGSSSSDNYIDHTDGK